MYRSRLTVPPENRRAEIASILEASQRKNLDREVTGALLIWVDYVVQTLEGQEDVVRGLFEKIAGDPRHEAVTLLEAHHVDARTFGRWSMARVSDVDGPGPDAERRGSDPVIMTMREHAERRGPSGVSAL